MQATRDRGPRSIIKNRAQGYEWEDGQLVIRDHSLTDVFSAGAVVSTVQDLQCSESLNFDGAVSDEACQQSAREHFGDRTNPKQCLSIWSPGSPDQIRQSMVRHFAPRR